MNESKQAILLTMSVLAAYLYLQVPTLHYYSLQTFALVSVVYLLLQKRARGRFYLILPEGAAFSLALLNFAFLLLVGSSGSLTSAFFALTFIQLFFLALSLPTKVALLGALEILVFHFSLSLAIRSDLVLTMPEWSNLLALPVVMVFYLFAKSQYEKAYQNSLLLGAETRELLRAKSDDKAVSEFVSSLINRRLPMLEFLLSFPEKNKTTIESEVQVLKRDLNLLLRQIDQKEQPIDPTISADKADLSVEDLVKKVEVEVGEKDKLDDQ
jgi:predicted CopG family antitoxin